MTTAKAKVESKKYYEAVGRRKTSVARVRAVPESAAKATTWVVNGKPILKYFAPPLLRHHLEDIFAELTDAPKFAISVKVLGGGLMSQAGAVAHGLARALIIYQPEWRAVLKRRGYLRRDPRMKERRKFGLKKARKAPQWSKR